MKEIFKTTGIVTITLLTLYLFIVFYSVSFNIAEWSGTARVLFSLIGGSLVFGITAIRHMNEY